MSSTESLFEFDISNTSKPRGRPKKTPEDPEKEKRPRGRPKTTTEEQRKEYRRLFVKKQYHENPDFHREKRREYVYKKQGREVPEKLDPRGRKRSVVPQGLPKDPSELFCPPSESDEDKNT